MTSKFTPVAITLLAISIPVTLVISLGSPGGVIVEPVLDTDQDGIPNDKDFYDYGDGAVQIRIMNFQGTCGNLWEPCESKFRLSIDSEGDGSHETVVEVKFNDRDQVEEVLQKTVNVPDDLIKVSFTVEIWDMNSIVGGDYIDFVKGTGKWGTFEFDLSETSKQWNEKGSEVPYCSVTLEAFVIGI